MQFEDLPQHAARFLLSPEAASMTTSDLLTHFAHLLDTQDGIPVDRISWSVPTLHPELRLSQYVWRKGQEVERLQRLHTGTSTQNFLNSPFHALVAGPQTFIRFRLEAQTEPRPYPVLDEFYEQGFTDYLAILQPPRNPYEFAPITYCTRATEGFSDANLKALRTLLPLLTLTLNLHGQRNRVRHLMETYVGQDAASRVLEGHIRRGDLIDIEAAVCFCDLRDFTRLSQSLSQSDLLNLLDEAFEVVVNAVHEPGGDVLKFIGDAVLAVFRRAPDETDLGPAVRRAAQAAVAIIARAELVHAQREADGKAPLRLGLSVHVGNVAYGNIGSSTRLDFTVIGATVNIASRLEAFCKVLSAPIVLSEAAAQYLQGTSEDLGMRLQAMGPHPVRGVDLPMTLYAGFPIAPSLT